MIDPYFVARCSDCQLENKLPIKKQLSLPIKFITAGSIVDQKSMFSAHTFVGLTTLTLLGYAAWTDLKTRKIFNSTVCLIALCFVTAIFTSSTPPNVLGGVGMAILVFVFGYVLWHFGLLGGGDVKLLSVVALWSGFAYGFELILLTALAGGGIALVQLCVLKRREWYSWLKSFLLPSIIFPKSNDDRRETCVDGTQASDDSTSSAQLPYGVAIAIAGTWILFKQFGA